jgi:hypothetical protein
MIGTVISKNGKEIRLTAERWSHIVESHDYMAGNQDLVFETIEAPDIIVRIKEDEFVALNIMARPPSRRNIFLSYIKNMKEMGL